MDTRGGTEADVKTRISKAKAAFHILRNVWKTRVIGKTTKIRLGEDKPSSNRDRNSQEKMGMAWPHIEKAKHQHYETGLDVEPPGQAKGGGGGDRKTPGGVTLRQTSRKRG